MFTEDSFSSNQPSFSQYLAFHAHWEDSNPPPARQPIESLPEEEEDDQDLSSSNHDQRFSAIHEDHLNPPGLASPQPHAFSASSASASSRNLSVSPAASFLSMFSSPTPQARKPDDEGQVISGYTLGPVIGYGGSSIIRRASSSSGTIAAVKIIRRSDLVKAGNAPQARKRLQHEAVVWASLGHEHILPLFSVAHTPYADYFFTLYCPAGSLFDILKRDGNPALPQDDTGMMFRQVVRGIRYLHEVARIVHRDLKLENVLIDDMGVCKIGDFGMSRKIGSLDDGSDDNEEHMDHNPNCLAPGNPSVHRAFSLSTPSSKRQSLGPLLTVNRYNTTRHRNSTSTSEAIHPFQPGSLPYAAPELLLPQTSEALRPHPSQDIWALGVMLYTLLTGRLPFSDPFEPRLQMKILNGTYDVPQGIGRGAERILEGCLDRSINNRWNIAEVDEIAWGVGWGPEGDEAALNDEELDHPCSVSVSRSQSRSHSRSPPDLAISDSRGEDHRSRPALNAASRRSSSRAQRSLSRAPIFSDRTNSSRSMSRHSRRTSRCPSPSSAARAGFSTPHSIATTPSSDSSSYGAFFDESALVVSPTSSICSSGRGRRKNKSYHPSSRSPSPSIAPTTPLDGPLRLLASPTDLVEQPEDLHLDAESSRGRSSLRALVSGSDKVHDGSGHRALLYGQEMHGWAAQPLSEEPVISTDDDMIDHSNIQVSAHLTETCTHWRQRPTSSPPTVPRLQPRVGAAPSSQLDTFLTSNAALSATASIARSRSVDAHKGH